MKEAPKRSNEPLVWLMFGGGTTVSAMVFPILILIVCFLLPFGFIGLPELANIIAFTQSWIGKLILLAVLILPVWGSLHRIHHGLHDFKVHLPAGAFIFYGLALLLSIISVFVVLHL